MRAIYGHRTWRTLLVLACVLVAPAHASETGVRLSEYQKGQSEEVLQLSLEEAIALAVRNNRSIKSAYLQRVSQKFDLYVSEGKFFPKMTLSTSALNGKANGVQSNSKVLSTATTLTLPTGAFVSLVTDRGVGPGSEQSSTLISVKQPLLKNGGISINSASVRMAELDEQVNRLALKSVLSQTVVQVIYAYRELLRAQEQREIAETSLHRSKDLLEVNRALIAAGRMASVEVFQTEADVANREVALEEAENQIDSSRLALLTLLGLESRTPLQALPPKNVSRQSFDVKQAMDKALLYQADYQIANLLLDRANINLEYAENQKLWDLSLVAENNRTRGTTGSGAANTSIAVKNNTSFAGLQLIIPLGDRSSEQAAVRAKVELETQELRVLETRQSVEQRIRDATRNVQTRWRQLELSQKALNLSLLKLNAEKDKLQAGRSTNFQVLSFENDLRSAENLQLTAQIAYLNALTDLDDRMGTTLENWGIPVIDTGSYEN